MAKPVKPTKLGGAGVHLPQRGRREDAVQVTKWGQMEQEKFVAAYVGQEVLTWAKVPDKVVSSVIKIGEKGESCVLLIARIAGAKADFELSDCILFVNSEERSSVDVQLVRTQIKKLNLKVREENLVSGDFLGNIYQEARSYLEVGIVVQDQTEVQTEIHGILRRAANLRASDIHFCSYRDRGAYYFRVDGHMVYQKRTVAQDMDAIFKVFYQSAVDTAEPQYDRQKYEGARLTPVQMVLPEGVQSLRLQYAPLTDDGAYLVIRLLYSESIKGAADVDSLGYSSFQLSLIQSFRRQPWGMVIIVGTTGSGKSTTLQMCMQAMLEESGGTKNIVTIEDPVEYTIPGARQIPVTGVDEARGASYTRAVVAALRLDPDVIMVSEVRDGKSAALAVKASMTGHQVWTTCHATFAAHTFRRLENDDVNILMMLEKEVTCGLIAQRLLRVLCEGCKIPYMEAEAAGVYDIQPTFASGFKRLFKGLENPGWVTSHLVYSANRKVGEKGCGRKGCRNGYRGRTVVAEVIAPDDQFYVLMKTEGVGAAEDYWVNTMGGVRMREHGMMHLLAGKVDPFDLDECVGLVNTFEPERITNVLELAEKEGLIRPEGDVYRHVARILSDTEDSEDTEDAGKDTSEDTEKLNITGISATPDEGSQKMMEVSA